MQVNLWGAPAPVAPVLPTPLNVLPRVYLCVCVYVVYVFVCVLVCASVCVCVCVCVCLSKMQFC